MADGHNIKLFYSVDSGCKRVLVDGNELLGVVEAKVITQENGKYPDVVIVLKPNKLDVRRATERELLDENGYGIGAFVEEWGDENSQLA